MDKENQNYTRVEILSDILNFNINLDAQLTSKANFILGASTFVLVFSLNKVLSNDFLQLNTMLRSPWFMLLGGSFIAAVLSIMLVLPKIYFFSFKKRIKQDIFYYKNIGEYFNRRTYGEYLAKLPDSEELINEAYANQIYSLSQHILPYKFRMLKISGWTLIITILLAMKLFILCYFLI
jgi:hypothetical protein